MTGQSRSSASAAVLRGCLGLALFLATAACNSAGPEAPEPRSVTGSQAFLIAEGPELRRLDENGETPILHLESGAFILDPAISQDGRQLAFAIQPPALKNSEGLLDFGSDLYLAPTEGGAPKLLLQHTTPGEFVREPAFLPDGRHLLFDIRGTNEAGLSDYRIEILDLQDGTRRRLINDAYEPELSPDGKTIACVASDPNTGQEDILLFDLATSKSSTLLGSSSTKVGVSSLIWSPDGKQLAFAAADPFVLGSAFRGRTGQALEHPTLRDIWLVNRDASGLRRLNDLAEPQPSLAWSADGASIYVLGLGGMLRVDATNGTAAEIGPGSYGGQLLLLPP